MNDILFHTKDYIFSYRVSGILIQDSKILLHKTIEDDGFAFPGGHAAFGETNEETLIREFKEELGVDITVGELKWVGEIFFPWNKKPCHQISITYIVNLKNGNKIPFEGRFIGKEVMENKLFNIEFHWIPLKEISNIKIYPTDAKILLNELNSGVKHFVFKE